MILLKHLQLKNFLSHPDTAIEFQSSERLLIDGKSGAGKSAILDALVWALYNVGRVQGRSLIKRGAKNMEVIVHLVDIFPDSQRGYVIKRSLTAAGKHSIEVYTKDPEDVALIPVAISGTKAIQEYIEHQILRCSYTLFINSVCYPQENLESFVRQTPAKRKDLILELVHAEAYADYYEKARELATTFSEKLAVAQGQRQQQQIELEQFKDTAKHVGEYQIDVDQINEDIKKTNELLEAARSEEVELLRMKDRADNFQTEIKRLENEVDKLYPDRDALTTKIQKLKELDESSIKEKISYLETVKAEITALEDKINRLYAWRDEYDAVKAAEPQGSSAQEQMEHLSSQIATLRKRTVQDEICNHCGKKHPCLLIYTEIERQIADLTRQMLALKEAQQAYNTALAAYKVKRDEVWARKPEVDQDRLIGLRSEVIRLTPYLEQSYKLATRDELLGQYQTDIAKINEKINALNQQITDKKIAKKAVEDLLATKVENGAKVKLINQREILEGRLWEAMERLTLAKSAFERIKTLTGDIKESAEASFKLQGDLNNLLLLKDAFGSNGIKSIVIDYVLPQLEQRINTVLQSLTDFRVKFDTQKSNVSGESKIEGLFITVVNDQGEEFDYDSYSGGQRVKILFAITEGLAQMQKVGFRILDEAVVGLDDESGDQFAQAILAFQERFQQLICISHLQQIKDLFETKIMVVNQRGDSTI